MSGYITPLKRTSQIAPLDEVSSGNLTLRDLLSLADRVDPKTGQFLNPLAGTLARAVMAEYSIKPRQTPVQFPKTLLPPVVSEILRLYVDEQKSFAHIASAFRKQGKPISDTVIRRVLMAYGIPIRHNLSVNSSTKRHDYQLIFSLSATGLIPAEIAREYQRRTGYPIHKSTVRAILKAVT